jgi:hypothetical protein
MFGFLLGAIAGGVAVYYWRDRLRTYVNDGLPQVRDRAADSLGHIGERAKSRIDSTIRTGQERLRSAGPMGSAASGSATTGTGSSRTGA